jgi:hypothetical protein
MAYLHSYDLMRAEVCTGSAMNADYRFFFILIIENGVNCTSFNTLAATGATLFFVLHSSTIPLFQCLRRTGLSTRWIAASTANKSNKFTLQTPGRSYLDSAFSG